MTVRGDGIDLIADLRWGTDAIDLVRYRFGSVDRARSFASDETEASVRAQGGPHSA